MGRKTSERTRLRTTVEVLAITVVGGSRARAASMPVGPAVGTVRRVAARAAPRGPIAPLGAPSSADPRAGGVRACDRRPGPWLGVRTDRHARLFGSHDSPPPARVGGGGIGG